MYMGFSHIFSFQPFPETTVQEAMSEVHRLKHHYMERKAHHSMIEYDNFSSSMQPRLALSWAVHITHDTEHSSNRYIAVLHVSCLNFLR